MLWLSIETEHTCRNIKFSARSVLAALAKGCKSVIYHNPLSRASGKIQLLRLVFASDLVLYFACEPLEVGYNYYLHRHIYYLNILPLPHVAEVGKEPKEIYSTFASLYLQTFTPQLKTCK